MLAFLINCKLWQLWDFLWFNFRELYFQILGNLQPLKWTSFFFYLLTNDFVFVTFLRADGLLLRWCIQPRFYSVKQVQHLWCWFYWICFLVSRVLWLYPYFNCFQRIRYVIEIKQLLFIISLLDLLFHNWRF